MQIAELTHDEIEQVAGGPGPLLLAFCAGFKAAKLCATMKAAFVAVGAASAMAALQNKD
jgi:hypothetical protein